MNPWTAACQASLSITNPWSLCKLMSIESVMTSNHLILCHLLLLLPSIFASIKVLSNDSALCIRWPKYWRFSISPSNEYSGLISFKIQYVWCPYKKEIRQTWRRKAREDKAETGVMLTQAKGRLGPPELKESRKDFPRRLWRE